MILLLEDNALMCCAGLGTEELKRLTSTDVRDGPSPHCLQNDAANPPLADDDNLSDVLFIIVSSTAALPAIAEARRRMPAK